MMKLNKFKFKKLDKKQIMDLTYIIIIFLIISGMLYYTYNKAGKNEKFYQPLWVEAEKEKEAAKKAAEEAKAKEEAEKKRKEEEEKNTVNILGYKITNPFK